MIISENGPRIYIIVNSLGFDHDNAFFKRFIGTLNSKQLL